jgi:hypothetical protein
MALLLEGLEDSRGRGWLLLTSQRRNELSILRECQRRGNLDIWSNTAYSLDFRKLPASIEIRQQCIFP